VTGGVPAAVNWILQQPSDPFTLDAKCLLLDLGLVTDPDAAAQIRVDKLAHVLASRAGDGGFISKYGGDCGSVLWTAAALRFLSQEHGEDAAAADSGLRFLASRQLPDGSWLERPDLPWGRDWYRNHGAHVWITGAVLQSLRGIPAAQPMSEAGWHFMYKVLDQFALLAMRPAPAAAFYAAGLDQFSLAVAVETFRHGNRPVPHERLLGGHLAARQADDGLWGASLDVTQATGTALLTLARPDQVPQVVRAVRALLSGQKSDGSWSHEAGRPGDWTLTAYTTRFLTRWVGACGSGSEPLEGP
jgi:hypothetical protein